MNRNGWSDNQLMAAMNVAVGCMKENYGLTIGAMREAGFKKLGGGHYGSAWTRHDMKGYCVKVSGCNPNDSFPAFVYWSMANPMPCIPEYRMPVFSADREQFMVMMPEYVNNSDALDFDEDFKTARGFLYGSSAEPRSDLQRACQEIGGFFYGKVQFDLHSDNAMWDEVKGEYVITDPIHQGDTLTLVGELTGKKLKPLRQVEHQLALDLPRTLESSSVVKPEFEGAVSQAFFPRPKANQKVARELHEDLKPHQMMQFPKMRMPNIEGVQAFDMGRKFGKSAWEQFADLIGGPRKRIQPLQMQANVHDSIGRAAQWVRDNGLTPQQAKRIGEVAQEWDDNRLARWPQPHVEFCLMPELPSFVCRPVEAGIPSAAIAVKRFMVPVDVVRTLRDQFKIHARQPHLDPRRQHKFNREFMLDRR